jgi:hypothetical protein
LTISPAVTTTVADRASPRFLPAETNTLPPAAPEGVTDNHPASETADQTGKLLVTRTAASAPDAEADHEDLDKPKLPATWVTANSRTKPPASNRTTPALAESPGFGSATTSADAPEPPDEGATDNQPGALLDQAS